jgi:hypothetical protein
LGGHIWQSTRHRFGMRSAAASQPRENSDNLHLQPSPPLAAAEAAN